MANKCFDNYITIKGSGVTPTSGLYINDLPGINLRSAANVADSEYQSGLVFLQDKISFATQLCVEELRTYFLPYFRINSIVDDHRFGVFKTAALNPQASERGIKLKRHSSRMLKLRVERIKIKLQQVGFVHSVEITDGNVQTSYDFKTDLNGEAEIDLSYLATEKEIFVTMDNAAINPIDATIKKACNCYAHKGRYISGYGWNGTGTASSTFGLQVDVSAPCDEDEFACAIIHRLKFPILYRAGIEIVKEMIATDRLNSFTLLDQETAEFY